ncbi:sensor histidine kinase [Mycetocola zhadangensis]|uniref:histidine kinase n=1 Tax=Mycetocola zhadangensis TaxID=1164595 RepID=A0A3L7ISB5_9MICO|nr:HAMP domain-containing sensor histidine kinase [Mycetocola zhadangensis]RLQ80990.1 sensor histidine kinase [Mycetocola zhadangensis]GGF03762.1 two-component sensor histidine kinase [Mycetocola zhadangensis]
MSRWTLRKRLVVAVVTLLALAAVVIGFASVVSVRSVLLGRVDAQLTAATTRSSGAAESPQGNGGSFPRQEQPPVPEFVGVPGQSAGTLGAIISGGAVRYAGYLDETGELRPLTTGQVATLLSVRLGGEPESIDLGGELGSYRVVAVEAGDGAMIVGLPLADLEFTLGQLIAVISAIALGVLLLAGAASYVIVRLALRPLDRVAQAASDVSELPLDRGHVAIAVRVPDEDADPNTEVGRVGASINRMLGHIAAALTARQASENKVRTFVSDASHELRTPLASIRGYAELTRRSGEELPEDATYALGRIESEAVRMTAIVEDLLLLARLDEGRDLARDPVELGALVAAAVSDAKAAAPEHDWQIELPGRDVVVTGDSQRLFQTVANLLGNARVHTPTGTRVVAALEVDGAVARISVTDNGPGIDPSVLSSVFERFVRGDQSRQRASGGTGLGLAIVSGVVEAHAGTVAVESVSGNTRFTVTLPLVAGTVDADGRVGYGKGAASAMP